MLRTQESVQSNQSLAHGKALRLVKYSNLYHFEIRNSGNCVNKTANVFILGTGVSLKVRSEAACIILGF